MSHANLQFVSLKRKTLFIFEGFRRWECQNRNQHDLLYLLVVSNPRNVQFSTNKIILPPMSYIAFVEAKIALCSDNRLPENNNNHRDLVPGGRKSSIPAISHDTLRDGRKGDKIVGKTSTTTD